jgi:hypothetical protein
MPLDLRLPITSEEWLFLQLADACLGGDCRPLDSAIAKIQEEVESRRNRRQ